MPRPLIRRAFIATGIAAGLTTWATAGFGAPKPYELAPKHATIAFTFSANGTPQTGTVPVESAKIWIDITRLSNSSAEVTANIQNARTGFLPATQALKSAEILDAANHPIVRFTSTRIRLGAQGRISEGAQIEGDLTLRGRTRPITLDATLSRPPGSAPDDLSVLFVSLTGVISRSAFGAAGYASLVEDSVRLDIRAEIRALR